MDDRTEDHKKHVQEMKKLLEKKEGKEVTWKDAEEATRNLAGLAEILYELWVKEKQREKRLAKSPKGFLLEGGYSCLICGQSGARNGGIWFDKFGMKCMVCQRAVNRKEIPGSLAKHKDSWYSEFDIEHSFNLKSTDITKWIKGGILKARIVMGENGRPHVRVFLVKDNKDTLPPKKLIESHMVKEERDGQTWFRSYPWYCFGDPREHLKGYKIMDYLRVIPPEEMKAREGEERRQWEERRAKREARKKLRKKL